MSDPKEITLKEYRLRAKLPQYVRILAIAALAAALMIVAAGLYRERSKTPFRLKSEHTQLSTDVVAEVSGYERLETDGETPKYYIKADHAKTFSDQHQELQNVYLEVYAADGVSKDVMSSDSALYIPEPDKNFTAYFRGNVDIRTRQDLYVKTNHLVYTKSTEIAEADEDVEFDRQNVKGKSFGAIVNIAEKRIELLKNVEIETFDSPDLAKSNIRYAKINAVRAVFDHAANNISLDRNVAINLVSRSRAGGEQKTDIHAGRASLNFSGQDVKSAQLKIFELFDNVRISSTEQGKTPTNIEAGYALYNKDADRFELKQGSQIVTVSGDKQTEVRAEDIVYERSAGKAALSGGSEIRQGVDVIKGDRIFADFFANGKVKEAIVRGNASARQTTPERTTIVTGPELNALFQDSGILRTANAVGESSVEIVPQSGSEYTRIVTNAGRGIGMLFKGEGLIESMRTDGRTTIQLDSRSGDPKSSNKRVTADAIKTVFQANGKHLQKAEAVGNAELFIEPLTADVKNYRTTINAPRFDCEFFATGNNVRSCVAGRNAKATRVPTIPTERRGTQTLSSERMTASFGQGSSDIEQLEASGSAKFNELDRNAIASQFTFTQSTGVLTMRGGEPTVWDTRARAKASEIDWHTTENRSYLRGAVSTTYYSPRQMRGSSPFGSMGKPVFLTAASAEIDHSAETALYTGNARGWQDNNYVRAERIYIDQNGGRFNAEGNVQSALYAARLRGSGAAVPTSASAGSMTYQRESRILQYRNNVDIRQGTDRITAGAADVFLDEKNELAKTIAENNVVITQPGRRATGTWAQYTAEDEVAVLRGQPATVSDAESGSTQNAEITFFMREKRVIAEGSSKQNTSGRSRSVYKIKVPNE